MSDDPTQTIQQMGWMSEYALGMVFVALIMALSMLTATASVIAFLFTMSLFRVPEEHRQMKLKSIWLLLIPLYGVYWIFPVVTKITASFRSYFEVQDPDEVRIPQGDYGRQRGMMMCFAAAGVHASSLLLLTKNPYVFGVIAGILTLAALVFTFLYFAQLLSIRRLIPDPETELPEDYL